MGIKVTRKEQPIESITIARKGFAPLVLTETDSGKIRVAVDKEGVQAYLLSKEAAADLVSGLAEFGIKAAA